MILAISLCELCKKRNAFQGWSVEREKKLGIVDQGDERLQEIYPAALPY
jgi:hypothetical protein